MNKVVIAPKDGYCTPEILPLAFNIPICEQYVRHVLMSPYFLAYTKICSRGIKMPRLGTNDGKKAFFSLPPLAEQKRIVVAVEAQFELISQIETAQAELTDLANLAKSKILDLAMRGKLVPQDPNDEPANELLARLSPSHKSHYEKLADLPSSWAVIRFGDVCKIFNGNSINDDYKIKNYTGLKSGYNFIATKDIGFNGDIAYENGVKIPFEINKGFKIAHKGTPLLCIEGGSAGRKVGVLMQDVCFGNKLCAFESDIVNRKFIFYFLQTPQFLSLFHENKNGLIGGVSINKLKDLSFLIPPKKEQARIVSKIELLLDQLNLFQ